MVRRYAPRRSPLYLQIDHRAPTPRRADSGLPCGGLIPPDPRDAFGPNSPAPPRSTRRTCPTSRFIRELPRLAASTTEAIAERYRCGSRRCWRSTGEAKIVAALRRAHELDDTVLMFTSDNGFFYGEHRIPEQKTRPYEEAPRPPDPGSGSLSGRRRCRRLPEPGRQHRPHDPRSRRRRSVPRGATLQGDGRPLAARPDPGARRGPRTAESRSSSTPGSGLGPPSCAATRACARRHLHQVHGGRRPLTGECRPIDETEHYDLVGGPVPARQPVPGRSGRPRPRSRTRSTRASSGCASARGSPGATRFRRGTSTASNGRRARPIGRPGTASGQGKLDGIEMLTPVGGRRRGRGALRAGRRDGRLLAAARW